MIAYQIALHPLSAKILMTDYDHDGKIIIPSHDPISDLLMSVRSHSKSITQIMTVCSTQKKVSPSCGYAIFLYHKRKCFDYCQTANEYGKSVKSAMESWFAYYDIDMEYDIDTMYREWQRYKDVNPLKPKPEKEHVSFVIRYADVDKVMSHVVASCVDLFYTRRQKFNYHLVEQLGTYTHKKVKGSFPKGVSNRNGYYQMQQWEAFMQQHPEIRKVYDKMLNIK